MEDRHTRALGRFSPASLFTKFEFFKWEMDEAMASRSPNEELYYVQSTLIHEWIHQVQILTTSFGRELMFLLLHSGLMVGEAYAKYVEDGNYSRLRRPLVTNSFFDKKFRKSMTNSQYIGLITGSLVRRYWGGNSNAKYLDGPFPDLLSNRFVQPQTTSCPEIEFEGGALNLGAIHILEGFASLNERIFIYLKFEDAIFHKALKKIPRYPYHVAEAYIESELGTESVNLWLCRMLYDVALNGCFDPLDSSTKVVWEDVHPGWRLVRAVQYLKQKRDMLKDFSTDTALAVRTSLCEAFAWTDPWDDHLGFAHIFEGFIPEVLDLRRNHPLTVMFCIENFGELVKRIPFSFGHPPPPSSLEHFNVMLLGDGLSVEQKFAGYMQLAMVAESVLEILTSVELSCPIHGISLEAANKCVPDCDFVTWFKTVLGMTVDEFTAIPVATNDDFDDFKREELLGE